MQVVLVAHHYLPDFEGGTESVVRAQARELTARGHAVRIVAGTDRGHTGADVERHEVGGLEVAFVPYKRDELYDLELERPRLRALVRELCAGADLVHVHHWSTLHAHLVRDARAAGQRVVATLHDLFVTCPRVFRLPPDPAIVCPPPGAFETCARCVQPDAGWPLERLLAGFQKRHAWVAAELDAAHAVVVPSRAQAARIGSHVPLDPARLHVVPHGLSDPLPRLVTRGWDGATPLRVLFLGHRSDVKGVRELVHGAAALPAEARARLELVLLGDEVHRGYDDELRRAGEGLHLSFLGNYTLPELPRRFQEIGGAHLGAFPSRAWESYGLVPDELWALGLPVWVTDRGAPQERVAGAGRVLPAEDPGAWTRALAEILADPSTLERERAALAGTPRTAVEAVRQLEGIYRGSRASSVPRQSEGDGA